MVLTGRQFLHPVEPRLICPWPGMPENGCPAPDDPTHLMRCVCVCVCVCNVVRKILYRNIVFSLCTPGHMRMEGTIRYTKLWIVIMSCHSIASTNLSVELYCTSELPWGSPPRWRKRFPRLCACWTPPSQGTTFATHSVA